MQKIWLDSYPEGVPEEIDADAYQSIIEIFDESVRKYGEKPAFENMGTIYSFNQLEHDVNSRGYASPGWRDLLSHVVGAPMQQRYLRLRTGLFVYKRMSIERGARKNRVLQSSCLVLKRRFAQSLRVADNLLLLAKLANLPGSGSPVVVLFGLRLRGTPAAAGSGCSLILCLPS